MNGYFRQPDGMFLVLFQLDFTAYTRLDLAICLNISDRHIVNPVAKRESSFQYSSIAQLAEHSTVNRRVTGSSPVGGASNLLATDKPRCRGGFWVK